jgi:steroid delta-isomerase
MSIEQHPAIIASHNSWRCVQARLKDEWLSLLADDVVIEDPIGVAPSNPTGEGFRGRSEAEKFWELGPGAAESILIQAHQSHACANQAAHVLTLRSRFPGGTLITVNGIFTYTVDEAGKISALRGYWSMDDMKVDKSA